MPPVRTAPAIKPIKTERTHEENQERAYIAASRRSDRSLEARVESARRASEIHKRRTGRSLRVTEQDVVNEEMYEEEDDDLPMQYRRLTAHLQTSNAEFDRRLAAYLTNHVAMRTALGQAVTQSQMYPNAPQFAGQGSQMSSTPFSAQQAMGPLQHNKSAFRQSPYPVPIHGTNSSVHSRSASVASPNEIQNFVNQSTIASRRMSMPVKNGQAERKPGNIANLKYEHAENGAAPTLSTPKWSGSGIEQTIPQAQSQQLKPTEFPNPFGASSNPLAAGFGAMPFSTSLPFESQQLLAGAFDYNDPMTSLLMGSDFNSDQQFFAQDNNSTHSPNELKAKPTFTPHELKVKSEFSPTTNMIGMNQTLTRGFLETEGSGFGNSSIPNSAYTKSSPFDSPADSFDVGFGASYNDSFKAFTNGLGSGQNTPANERDWQSMIDGTVWDEPSSQTT